MADNLTPDDIERLRQAFASLTDGSVGLSEEQIRLRSSLKGSSEASDNFKKNLQEAGKNAKDALNGLKDSVLSTEKGMTKYAGTVGSATSAVSNLAKGFGPLGFAIGLVAKAFGALTEGVLKQNDSMIKAYDELASVGGAAGLTTRDVLELGSKAGYTSHNLEIFTKHTRSLGTDLLALGTTAAGGMKTFAQMAEVTQEVRDQYNNLGISQEQLTEFQADYVKTMVLTGQTLAKSPVQLQAASLKYIDSLNELAAITGLDVKQAQEKQRQAFAQENFNAYMNNKAMERDRLRDQAEKEADPVRKQALKAQSDQIDSVIKAKTQFATLAQDTMSAQNAASALESISTDNATVMTESNAKFAMMGINISDMNDNLNRGVRQDVELRKSQAKAVEDFNARYGESGYAYGKSSRELQEIMGVDNKMRSEYTKNQSLLTKEGEEKYRAEQAEAERNIQLRKEHNDDIKDTQNQQNAAELATRKAQDAMTNLISGPINSALKFFGEMVQSLAETVGNILSSWPFNMFSSKKPAPAGSAPTIAPTVEGGSIVGGAGGEGDFGAIMSAATAGAERRAQVKQEGIPNQAEFLSKLSAAGITDKRAQANILAQVKAESGGVAKSENLNYSPEQLMKLFPKKFASLEEAQRVVAEGPETIGNRIYGGRMGNTAEEGYKYRGRGLIQLTGKDNYKKFGDLLGIDLVANPDLANDPGIAQKIAVAYFQTKGKGKDLSNIKEVGSIVGYAGGSAETERRSDYAQAFLEQLQQGANGGIFGGPTSGYPVTLHGNEIVIPDFKLPELAQTLNSVTKQELPSPTVATTSNSGNGESGQILLAMMNMMEDKLDQVISQLNSSNATQDKILTYSLV